MFIVVDITYNERMWEFNPFAFRARLLAMGITLLIPNLIHILGKNRPLWNGARF